MAEENGFRMESDSWLVSGERLRGRPICDSRVGSQSHSLKSGFLPCVSCLTELNCMYVQAAPLMANYTQPCAVLSNFILEFILL